MKALQLAHGPSSIPAIQAKAGDRELAPDRGGNSECIPSEYGVQGKEFESVLFVPSWVPFAFYLLSPVLLPTSSIVRGLRPRLTLCRVIF